MVCCIYTACNFSLRFSPHSGDVIKQRRFEWPVDVTYSTVQTGIVVLVVAEGSLYYTLLLDKATRRYVPC